MRASNLLVDLVIKMEQTEGIFVMDVEGSFPNKSKEKVHASTSASTSSLVFPLSHYGQAIQAALIFLRAPPDFNPLHEFHLHLKKNYEGFHRDQT